eukprot:6716334-Prorocentrum_lima.AAC.1
MECRLQDWPKFTEEERVANPNYCPYEQVMKDMKRANKGSHWKTMAGNINRAKRELQEETSNSASGSLQAKTQQ